MGKKDKVIMAGGPLVWKYCGLFDAGTRSIPWDSENAILLEDKSRTTEEDARFTKEIMNRHGYKSCILVTSPYHSRIAPSEFSHKNYGR